MYHLEGKKVLLTGGATSIGRRIATRMAEEGWNARPAQIALGRVGLPDDVARVVAFLASDEAAYMTGQAINVTGGLWMH